MIAVSFIYASWRDPGYLTAEQNFLDLLSKVHPCEMCPDCQVLRTPRSRHCAICNRCVERFDHHCPWLNNCVGVNNNNAFLTYLISLSICILFIISSSLLSVISPCENDDCPMESMCVACDTEWLVVIVVVITLVVLIFFLLPVMLLCWIQVNNYRLNKTSNERFARSARTASMDESEINGSVLGQNSLRRRRRGCTGNYSQMCCPAET